MVKAIPNTTDNSDERFQGAVDMIVSAFNAGVRDFYTDDYAAKFPVGVLEEAMRRIKLAGWYIWVITGHFGHNYAYDTVYTVTNVNIKPYGYYHWEEPNDR